MVLTIDAPAVRYGIAACVTIDLFVTELELLVGYKWKSGITAGTTCDMGAFKTPPAGSAPPKSGAVVGGNTIYVPATDGVQTYSVDIPGQGGVPLISVHDLIQNETVSSDPAHPEEPQNTPHMALIPSPATSSVRLVLINQKKYVGVGNEYTVSAQPGSVPLGKAGAGARTARRAGGESFTVAQTYAPAKVKAKVVGKGRARAVVWSATHLTDAGRSVRFVETDGRGLQHVLKATTKQSGKMKFTTADGRAGTRAIKAVIVNAQGVPISSATVTRFKAPGYVLPAKAAKLKLSVKRDRLRVTWKGKRSKSWLVLVTVQDGRRLRLTTTRNALAIPGVSRRENVTVKVVGVDAQGRRGKASAARRR